MFDASLSRTDREELSIEAYSGTGYNGANTGNGASATIGFRSGPTGTVFSPSLNYSDPTRIFLTDPLGWGGDRVQAGYYNNRIVADELKQLRAEVAKEFDGSFIKAVKVGANYTLRDKSLTPDEFFVQPAGTATQIALPQNLQLRPTNLAYLGLGPILSYDARAVIDAGILRLSRNTSNDVPAKAFSIEEDLFTVYGQVDIDKEVGSGSLTGNIGVQAIHTVQSSTGFIFVPQPSGPALPQATTIGAKYWDVLPSLNLSLRLPSDTVIRFAAARQIQRPRLDDLRVSIGYGLDTSVPGGIIRGGGGNPTLRPYRANAFDFNVEQYFGSGGVIAAQFFYKDIDQFIFGGRTDFDFTGFPLQPGQTVASRIGTLDAQINTQGGELYGGELAVTFPLVNLTSALDGFGITGGYSYTKTKVLDAGGNPGPIPGYSENVANATVYFEKWGFNTRGSVRYRSTFLGDFTGFGGSPTRRTALGEMIVDAQIGYDFQPGSALAGLSLYLQGQNLTDERFASIGANPLQVIDYQIYGRRFLGGFTYKF